MKKNLAEMEKRKEGNILELLGELDEGEAGFRLFYLLLSKGVIEK